MKTLYKIFFIIFTPFALLFVVMFILALLVSLDPKDACLDSGVCKEGLPLRMNDGKEIIINRETCKQYNGEWREKYNDCYFRDYNDRWKF